jgi:Phage integrase family
MDIRHPSRSQQDRTRREDRQLNFYNARDKLKTEERKAKGLEPLQPLGLHESRHSYASLMIAAGVNAKGLSTYMGHAAIAITLDRYGHLMPGSEEEAAGLLDAYLVRSAEKVSGSSLGETSITYAAHLEAVAHRSTLMGLRSYREDLLALLERRGGIGDVWQVDMGGLPIQHDPYIAATPSGWFADPSAWCCPWRLSRRGFDW